ncbi:MAG: hypothetical protein IKG56_03720 [Clostridia bacterium]|nr:hypothetical protein [Clostridia bacterium]
MDDNKTIIGLLLIIFILAAALFIKIFFFKDSTPSKIDINETFMSNWSVSAENAVANKTSGYTKSVQEEKENHNKLEQEWDQYQN